MISDRVILIGAEIVAVWLGAILLAVISAGIWHGVWPLWFVMLPLIPVEGAACIMLYEEITDR